MASVSTYLNFNGNTMEAFEFYKSVFGTEYVGPVARMGDVPPNPSMPPFPDSVKDRVLNVNLPITGGYFLRGADSIPELGHNLTVGNNAYVCLEPDTRKEADRIFAGLSEGGQVEMAPTEMFWGDYFASWTDKFGVGWMINTPAKE